MKPLFSRFFLVALMIVVAAPAATAQITGTIEGTVVDQAGAVLPGANITAESPAILAGSSTTTTVIWSPCSTS